MALFKDFKSVILRVSLVRLRISAGLMAKTITDIKTAKIATTIRSSIRVKEG